MTSTAGRKTPKTPPGITARQLVDGTWVYDVKVRLADGSVYQPRGFRRLRSEGDEVGAEDDMNDAKADARNGRPVRNRSLLRVTVGELAHAHLEAGKASGWSTRSYDKWTSDWKTMAKELDGPLVNLTSVQVADWLGRHQKKYARDTVNGRIGLLRAILDRGADQYGVANVARVVRRKRTRRAKTEVRRRALTPAEAALVVDAIEDRYRIAVLLCLGLGLRSGELRGLTVDRIDFEAGTVRIDRQLVRRRRDDPWDGPEDERLTTTLGFAALKTPNSYATLKVDDGVLDALEAHAADYPNDFGLVLSNTIGKPLVDQGWSKAVRAAAKAAGVPFVGHELRHTAGQWLYDQTKDLARVAAFLRDDIDTVQKVYVHAQADDSSSASIMGQLAACKPRARGHLRAV